MAKKLALTQYRPLDDQERRFVDQYWVHLDPVRAATEAGYDRGVAQNARMMLDEPHIAAEILRRQTGRSIRTNITMDRVVLELGRIALFDPAELVDENGHMLPLHKMPEDARRCIESMEVLPGAEDGPPTYRIKFASKLKALEQLAPHVQGWTPKVHKGKTRTDQEKIADMYAIVEQARKRASGALPASRFRATEISSNGKRTMFEVEIDGVPDEPLEKDVTPK